MIASLMMYARPELEGAHARYWALIRQSLKVRGIATPEGLSNDAPVFDVWQSPDLVLSQTCGMPFAVRLHAEVQLVGTPDFGIEGCAPGYYRSAIVVRADDPRKTLTDFADARFAYNEGLSQSGFSAPYAAARDAGFWFAHRVQTGGHLASARAVADGSADIAALDAMTWRLIERYEALAGGLRVLTLTEPTPGLPYITGPDKDARAIADGVAEAMDQLDAADRDALGLRGLVQIPKSDYMAVTLPPMNAA